jgi:polysaccharide biosynthesis protein VpsM
MDIRNLGGVFVTGVALLLASPAALPQSNPLVGSASLQNASSVAPPPGGIPLGPLIVYPAIDASIGHNDNLYSSNTNKGSSTQFVTSPSVRAEAKIGAHAFDLAFRLDDVRYSASPADSFTSYGLLGNANLVFSGRAGLRVRGEYRQSVDPRGSTDRAGGDSPDEYLNYGAEGIFTYGATGARGRIEIDAAAYARRYQNNRLNTEGSDRNSTALGGTFLWRVAPKTELLAVMQHRRVDFVLPSSTQDSTEMRYQFGAKWEATAKTSGILKMGILEKKFDSSGRTDFIGSSWDGTVRWSPLTYSVFDFYTSKATSESTGTGDFLLSKTYGVNWNHAWNSRFSTAAIGNWRQDDYLGTGGGRVDKTTTFGASLTYHFRRWLRFGGSYTVSERVSNPNTFDYTRHLWMITVGATL